MLTWDFSSLVSPEHPLIKTTLSNEARAVPVTNLIFDPQSIAQI